MKRIKEIRPMWATTVDPSEYDIDIQMECMVKLANRDKASFVKMDVGKVWGLYQAWKHLANAPRKMVSVCGGCGGTGQDDPPPGKYHGLCQRCHGSGKEGQ